MTSTAPTRSNGEWLESWDPENEETWDSRLAWRTLWVTTFALTLAFVAWFLPSALIPKLNPLGNSFSTTQLYWMAAMPGLSAGLFRLFWMVMLAMAWPLVIGFFLFGTALWLFGSVAHLIKRQYRRL